jgi:hypothetical protein
MTLQENIKRIKSMMGMDNSRLTFDMKKLLDDGVIFITQAHNLTTGKMYPPEKDPETVEMYYDSTNLITFHNLMEPEKGTQDGIPKAMKHPRPDMIDFWQDNQSWLLDDEKYKQILRSIELNDKEMFGKRYPNCVKIKK